ncbi:hypothetical protein PDG61_21105 [Mycolicibacterium sp. BiH015]|uniref:hypothetical protein n=1 Tax=Mycolicibacterium sp. BiH015 TaxID=3018808 RepID=UPI0022E32A98|nr:hypothetical protein [Mycolicibacterium sp. BiH015]MDA2893427.1 hypothetical protein [Mycolicibacterium sp. BiH015]
MHFGQLRIEPPTEDKLHRKHDGITFDDVVDAIQAPAETEAGWEYSDEHGWRVIALGTDARGREVICALIPIPEWDDYADTWMIKSARWLS